MRTLTELRAVAVSNSLFQPTSLKRAVERLGFVQADPIRSPAVIGGGLGSSIRSIPDKRKQTISADLVKEARRIYRDLCESQQYRRLLHGDLYHENVLFDRELVVNSQRL